MSRIILDLSDTDPTLLWAALPKLVVYAHGSSYSNCSSREYIRESRPRACDR